MLVEVEGFVRKKIKEMKNYVKTSKKNTSKKNHKGRK